MYSHTSNEQRPNYDMVEALMIDEKHKDSVDQYYRDQADGGEEERKVIAFVKKRKNAMDAQRSRVDARWNRYSALYDAVYYKVQKKKCIRTVPLMRSLVEMTINEMGKRKIEPRIKSVYGKEFEAKMLDRVWKSHWATSNLQAEIEASDYSALIYGTRVLSTGFQRKKRRISDLDVSSVDINGDFKFQDKIETTNSIYIHNEDPRYVWFDEKAENIGQVNDAVKVEYVPYQDFKNYELDTAYKNVAKVRPMYSYKEERQTNNMLDGYSEDACFVKVTKYWNMSADLYIEIANDGIIIRKHPIMNAQHEIPFSAGPLSKRSNGIYGTGIIEIAEPFLADINEFRDQYLEAVRRSNSETILIGPGLEFVGEDFAFNNKILSFNGQFAGNYQQLTGTAPNNSLVNILQEMYKEIAMYTGIDIRNVLGDPQQTAFQTAVQQENKNGRINVWLTNKEKTLEKTYSQHANNLQMFFPLALAKEVSQMDVDDDKAIKAPKKTGVPFEMDGEKVIQRDDEIDEEGNIRTKKGFVIQKTDGKHVFELAPEHLRADARVEVFTDFSSPTLVEVKKAQLMEFLQAMPGVAQIYSLPGVSDTIANKLPPEKLMTQLFDMFGIEYDTASSDDKEQAKKELMDMINGISGDMVNSGQMQEAGAMPSAAAPAGGMTVPSGTPGLQPPDIAAMANPARILQ